MGKVDTLGTISQNGVKEPPYQRKDRSEIKRSLVGYAALFSWLVVLIGLGYFGVVMRPQSAQHKEIRSSLDTIAYYELNESGQLVKKDKPQKQIVEKP